MAKNLSDADDGQVFSIDNDFASRCAHALPARPEEFKLPGLCSGGALPRLDGAEPRPHTSTQSFDELRSIHFTGGFAGGDENLHGTIVTGDETADWKGC